MVTGKKNQREEEKHEEGQEVVEVEEGEEEEEEEEKEEEEGEEKEKENEEKVRGAEEICKEVNNCSTRKYRIDLVLLFAEYGISPSYSVGPVRTEEIIL